MNLQAQQNEIANKQTEQKKFGFELMMKSPSVRMIVSMIPPSENPDALETLLREAFNQGFNCGATNAVIDMLGSLLPKPKPNA